MIGPPTPRLLATPLAPGDFGLLCAMHRDPDVMATLGGVRTDERTRAYLAENLAHWDEHGFGMWIFRDQKTGDFVGRGGLRHVVLDNRPEVEIFYALVRDAWGKGFATEIAAASLHVAFRQLALRDVVAFTLPDHAGSRRVMEKVGLRYERDIMHHDVRCVLYRILAP
ncbi:MAG: GNAT family N-acetyltransferase [Candidatus Rokubacteria bacterium]|nr:GNAT family N-acetyltransferase [Candidatus Rokubacteria bacterium]